MHTHHTYIDIEMHFVLLHTCMGAVVSLSFWSCMYTTAIIDVLACWHTWHDPVIAAAVSFVQSVNKFVTYIHTFTHDITM